MKKSGNDDRHETRMKLMGLGKSSMRKNYYRELMENQSQLEIKNTQLEKEIAQRVEAEKELKHLNDELEQRVEKRTEELKISMQELKQTQEYLLQTERLVALGSLVAGISHEVNTPLGICITSSTYLRRILDDLELRYEKGQLKKTIFEEMNREMKDITDVLQNNLNRSVELLNNFRMIASDQSHYEYRTFHICSYIKKVISSLGPELKSKKTKVHFRYDSDFEINGYPGVFSQIITNLVMNSLQHGFKNHGRIDLIFKEEEEGYTILYSDDGVGMNEQVKRRIFDPFFTTQMGTGSGLGMYIVHNLVVNQLSGNIEVKSTEDEGTCFRIHFPKKNNMK